MTKFTDLFNQIAKNRRRYEVFQDFIIMSACSFHNAIVKNQALENEYLKTIAKYSKEDVDKLCELLAILVELLQPEPKDILGPIYMDQGFGEQKLGQFMTPPEISKLLSGIMYRDPTENPDRPFFTVSDPAAGSGGMILAHANTLILHGKDPAKTMWAQCIELDRTLALMCYIQLTLWHIPAEVIVGNSLSMKVEEVYRTPAHYLHNWEHKLKEKL